MATIPGIYVALFGRPADPGGLEYFNERTQGGADLTAISDLANSEEYQSRFGGFSRKEVLQTIYESLFERGASFNEIEDWLELWNGQSATINDIAIRILDGARNEDLVTVNAKIAAAELFTAHLDLQIEKDAYDGRFAESVGRDYLDEVSATNAATSQEADIAILRLFPNQGEQPGGDGSAPANPPPPPPEDKIKVVVFDDDIYVDTEAQGLGEESTNVQASLIAKGFDVSTMQGASAEAFSAALVEKNVLLFPEQDTNDQPTLANVLSAEAKAVIEAFVEGGGKIIIHGDEVGNGAASGTKIINSIFGLSLTETFDVGESTKTAKAAGSFAGDGEALSANKLTSGINTASLPEKSVVLYQENDPASDVATIAAIQQGQGEIIYLGWDWDNAIAGMEQDGGWLEALASAVRYEWRDTPANIVIDFEEAISDAVPGNYEFPLAYQHLGWEGFNLNDPAVRALYGDTNAGYRNGVTSPVNAAFNGFGADASFFSPSTFDFESAFMTAASSDDLTVRVTGFNGITEVGSQLITLGTAVAQKVLFDDDIFDKVTKVTFSIADVGEDPFDRTQFVIDDIELIGLELDPVFTS